MEKKGIEKEKKENKRASIFFQKTHIKRFSMFFHKKTLKKGKKGNQCKRRAKKGSSFLNGSLTTMSECVQLIYSNYP